MEYRALARKWRPKTFEEMVGQQHILPALTHALTQNRLHHAYLFTGTRGIGKTTVARIFAKALNCETGITPTPCGNCQNCLEIDEGRFIDLIEVDAASRTKVEDTRELLENVQYAPTKGRFKIYLIDEVHMLSNHSFNALLKTLEEPPKHVKFLLATTDPQKLPITVLSRCLQLHLKALTQTQISQQLEKILNTEAISFETESLKILADAAQGSLRDALSLLDQAIVFSNSNITEQSVYNMLGQANTSIVWRLLEAIQNQDLSTLLKITEAMAEDNVDYGQTLQQFLACCHQIALLQFSADCVLENKAEVEKLANNIDKETIQLYYQIALIGHRDLTLSPSPRTGFEMCLLRLMAFQPAEYSHADKPTQIKKQIPALKNQIRQASSVEPLDNDDWLALINALPLTGLAKSLAQHCTKKQFENDKLDLTLSEKHKALLSDSVLQRLKVVLSAHYQKPITVDIQIGNQEKASPAQLIQKDKDQKQANANNDIKNDPKLQSLINHFDGTLQENTIKTKINSDNK